MEVREVRMNSILAIKTMDGFTEEMAFELGKIRWDLLIWRRKRERVERGMSWQREEDQ